MPRDQAESGPSAGIFSADASAVFERLKEGVRERAAAGGAGRRNRTRTSSRGDAERFWAVAVDRPIERRPGALGPLLYFAKRVVRKLVRWYVGPFAAEQRSFNAAVLRVADEQSERVDRLREALDRQVEDGAARAAELALTLEAIRRLEDEAG